MTHGIGSTREAGFVRAGRALGVVLALLLVPAGCGDGGGASLDDVPHWRARLAQGDTVAMDALVKGGARATGLLSTLLADEDETVVQMAAMTCQRLGETGADTVPALLAALDRFPDQPYVVQAVKAMKGSAIRPIVEALESGQAPRQAQAAKLLVGMGKVGAPAVPALVALLKGPAPDAAKMQALNAIGSLGLAAEEAEPTLQAMVEARGPLATHAATAIKRLESARKMAEIRGER